MLFTVLFLSRLFFLITHTLKVQGVFVLKAYHHSLSSVYSVFKLPVFVG
jgi:hypothetical protein